jgi:hypothetical protein
MDFETRGSPPQSLNMDPEKELGSKLTEKPILQDFVVEEDPVLPKVIYGLGQGNRLSVIKETNITRCKRLGQVASSLLASRVYSGKVQFECDFGNLI